MLEIEPRKVLGKRLAALRKAAGLTQPQLAIACEWLNEDGAPAQTRISNYETATREPSVEDTLTIAGALGIPLAAVYDFDEKLEQAGSRKKSMDEMLGGMNAKQIEAFLKKISSVLPDSLLLKVASQMTAVAAKNLEGRDT